MPKLHRIQFSALILLAAALGCGSSGTSAPATATPVPTPAPIIPTTPTPATQSTDAVYNGWISAYQVPDGSNFYLAKSFSDRSDGIWAPGYVLFEAEDAYFQNHSAARYTQITQLLNDFLAEKKGSNWTSDSWDDDLEWMIYAFIRGYEITGNSTYLNAATLNWNAVYARGWDSTFGGGIWENTTNDYTSKCVLSNAPFVFEGVEMYRATGISTYLTESQQVYEWMRTTLFNYTNTNSALGVPGQANQCASTTGMQYSANVYNQGLMLEAANALFRVTGSSEYSGDANLVANYAVNKWPIINVDYVSNGYFSGDHLFRGIAAYSTQNNLWATYGTWLQNNANASWAMRRTDYNITQNNLTIPTPTIGDLYSMETGASVTVQAVLPLPFTFTGNYELQSAASGLALDVTGASTSSGAAIVQTTYTGASSQLWTLVPTAGGCYQIKNVKSGLVLNVVGASTTTGALIQQSPAQPMQPGNDQWYPALNADGTYSFYSLNSQMALDVPGASTSTGIQLDQAFTNNAPSQKFTLTSH